MLPFITKETIGKPHSFKNLFDIDYFEHAFGRQDIKPGAPLQ